MKWKVKKIKKIEGKNSVLIEGLPGMGNVGKIAADFIVDNLKAEKVAEISSYAFPHCVFVNEKNLIELPIIELYQKKLKDKTLLIITGDIQPLDEVSCYEFCNLILDIFEENKGKEIITLGGIGQQQIPKKPKLYCTGNDKKIISKYCSSKISNKIYGIVGPIIGVSGVLLGVAGQRNIPAVAILSETFGHPTYLGIKEARELLTELDNKLNLGLNLKELDKEVSQIEHEIKTKTEELSKIAKKVVFPKIKKYDDTGYIG